MRYLGMGVFVLPVDITLGSLLALIRVASPGQSAEVVFTSGGPCCGPKSYQ